MSTGLFFQPTWVMQNLELPNSRHAIWVVQSLEQPNFRRRGAASLRQDCNVFVAELQPGKKLPALQLEPGRQAGRMQRSKSPHSNKLLPVPGWVSRESITTGDIHTCIYIYIYMFFQGTYCKQTEVMEAERKVREIYFPFGEPRCPLP